MPRFNIPTGYPQNVFKGFLEILIHCSSVSLDGHISKVNLGYSAQALIFQVNNEHLPRVLPESISYFMHSPANIRRSARQAAAKNSELDPTAVIPFGRYGAGLLTPHPVGMVVVIGVLVMGLVGLPEARWFFASALLLGCVWGFFLWVRHR